ncbi:hypothetical protein T02_7188 [Trichinella nativa]|uniref:Uncharacterized protein n=1 Tax=Trichinella nativa TaxID=6335 RepID=A0A0V1L7Z4_9BILA|nr:hypothetical protein T02_7188 [Trichinella nativa]
MLEIAQSIVLTEVEIAGRENALSCGILCSPTTVYLWKINDRVEVKLKSGEEQSSSVFSFKQNWYLNHVKE